MGSGVGRRGDPRSAMTACGLGTVLFLLANFAAGQTQQSPPGPGVEPVAASTATTPTGSGGGPRGQTTDYLVSPEDLLDVYVVGVEEVSRAYRVSSNGFLTLPLLPEPIPVAGLTLGQVSRLIATKYHDAGMISNAQVSVSLRETRWHTVLVTGEVVHPQSYPIFGPTRLLDILTQAGGLTPTAGDDAIVTRGEVGARADLEDSARTGGVDASLQQRSFTLNIRRMVDSGDQTANILLYPGDRVTVPRVALIYVLGAVNRPGGYALANPQERVTVLKALAMAGDTSRIAKRKHITVLRKDPLTVDEKRKQIPVNIKAILNGEMADLRLQPEDILYVPESGSAKALQQTTSTLLGSGSGILTGLVIYRGL